LLNASLDIFDLRSRDKNRVDQDLGLLHAVDERLSVWGWETGTGTRFAIVLDMYGRSTVEGEASGIGVKEGELRPAFRALQTAYIGLLRNPFYVPDEHTVAAGGGQIKSKGFIKEVERIGMGWRPGITTL
jgi:trafficking protein particle complex subunit 2